MPHFSHRSDTRRKQRYRCIRIRTPKFVLNMSISGIDTPKEYFDSFFGALLDLPNGFAMESRFSEAAVRQRATVQSGGRHFASREARAPLESIASPKQKLSLEIFVLEIARAGGKSRQSTSLASAFGPTGIQHDDQHVRPPQFPVVRARVVCEERRPLEVGTEPTQCQPRLIHSLFLHVQFCCNTWTGNRGRIGWITALTLAKPIHLARSTHVDSQRYLPCRVAVMRNRLVDLDQGAHLVGHEVVDLAWDPAATGLIHQSAASSILSSRFISDRCVEGSPLGVVGRSGRTQLHGDPSSRASRRTDGQCHLPVSKFVMQWIPASSTTDARLVSAELHPATFPDSD